MFLRKNYNNKTKRTHLAIVQSYRNKEGKTRHKTIQTLGYLDVLEKDYKDPISHFEKLAKEMTKKYNEDIKSIPVSISTLDCLPLSTDDRKNFGHAVLSKIYHDLEINYFINNRRRYTKAEYNHNAIFKLLVYGRLLFPGSKKYTFERKHRLFDKMDFTLDDVYRSLQFFTSFKQEMLLAIHKRIKKLYNRDTSLVYYDVTNYYFEIDQQDEVRKKGVSKEHRPDPIIQMGLMMDTDGVPITYDLFPGNCLDKQTLIPMLRSIRNEYELGRSIIVGDRGMLAGDNIRQVLLDENGYIFSYSIRGASSDFKEYVLSQDAYVIKNDDFKIKSRIYPREIIVSNIKGKKTKVTIDEKHVIFYSQKFADKAKRDRRAAVEKAIDLTTSPSKYKKAKFYGAAKYVDSLKYSQKTGEVLDDAEEQLIFNADKLAEEEKYDGYYAIITSELEMENEQIIDIYRGLWKIEECFKVTKSDLETRPVYLSKQDHIEAHFLICFVALVISKLIEKELKEKHSVRSILESLKKCACSPLEKNLYLFDYYDEVLADLGKQYDIDFSKKYRIMKDIKKIIGASKKTEV